MKSYYRRAVTYMAMDKFKEVRGTHHQEAKDAFTHFVCCVTSHEVLTWTQALVDLKIVAEKEPRNTNVQTMIRKCMAKLRSTAFTEAISSKPAKSGPAKPSSSRAPGQKKGTKKNKRKRMERKRRERAKPQVRKLVDISAVAAADVIDRDRTYLCVPRGVAFLTTCCQQWPA